MYRFVNFYSLHPCMNTSIRFVCHYIRRRDGLGFLMGDKRCICRSQHVGVCAWKCLWQRFYSTIWTTVLTNHSRFCLIDWDRLFILVDWYYSLSLYIWYEILGHCMLNWAGYMFLIILLYFVKLLLKEWLDSWFSPYIAHLVPIYHVRGFLRNLLAKYIV